VRFHRDRPDHGGLQEGAAHFEPDKLMVFGDVGMNAAQADGHIRLIFDGQKNVGFLALAGSPGPDITDPDILDFGGWWRRRSRFVLLGRFYPAKAHRGRKRQKRDGRGG